jgi:predicted ribosomally synthesized peptide with SipW-like signal peptide
MPARAVSTSHRSRKVRAVLASGLVVGVGAAFTLAAWTDTEWVFGGAGPNDTPGTKTYRMQQNTVAPFTNEADWTDRSEATDAGRLNFTINAANLLPGDTVYAPFQLRAKPGSETLTAFLTEAQQADDPAHGNSNSEALYDALTYTAWVGLDAADCSATGSRPVDIVPFVAPGSTLDTTSGTEIILKPGEPVDVCFAMTLPEDAPDTLQGTNVVPLWQFTSEAATSREAARSNTAS